MSERISNQTIEGLLMPHGSIERIGMPEFLLSGLPLREDSADSSVITAQSAGGTITHENPDGSVGVVPGTDWEDVVKQLNLRMVSNE